MNYVVRCEHCGGDVVTVPRIGDEEAAALRQHLRACPSIDSASVRRFSAVQAGTFAELLRHFRIATLTAPS